MVKPFEAGRTDGDCFGGEPNLLGGNIRLVTKVFKLKCKILKIKGLEPLEHRLL